MDTDNNPIQEVGVKTKETSNAETTQNAQAKKVNNMALVSFILSIIGLIVAGLPCGIVALITGIIGIVKFDSTKDKGKGFAIAGLIIGIFDIVASIINIVVQMSTLL